MQVLTHLYICLIHRLGAWFSLEMALTGSPTAFGLAVTMSGMIAWQCLAMLAHVFHLTVNHVYHFPTCILLLLFTAEVVIMGKNSWRKSRNAPEKCIMGVICCSLGSSRPLLLSLWVLWITCHLLWTRIYVFFIKTSCKISSKLEKTAQNIYRVGQNTECSCQGFSWAWSSFIIHILKWSIGVAMWSVPIPCCNSHLKLLKVLKTFTKKFFKSFSHQKSHARECQVSHVNNSQVFSPKFSTKANSCALLGHKLMSFTEFQSVIKSVHIMIPQFKILLNSTCFGDCIAMCWSWIAVISCSFYEWSNMSRYELCWFFL